MFYILTAATEVLWGMVMVTLGAWLVRAGWIAPEADLLAGLIAVEGALVAVIWLLYSALKGLVRARVTVEEIL
jgi:hypothetical protein